MGQTARGDVGRGMKAILTKLAYQADRTLGDTSYRNRISEIITESGDDAALKSLLSDWCQKLNNPLVLCIDEVDALVGDTLVSLLRQIRSGYPDRPTGFPASIILCGFVMSVITGFILTGSRRLSPMGVPSIVRQSHFVWEIFLKKKQKRSFCYTPQKPVRSLKMMPFQPYEP